MPNPFMRSGTPVQSHDDVDESRPRGAMQPVPERVAGPVFAYRGYETHGVEPQGTYRDPVDYEGDWGRDTIVDSEEVEPEPAAIPVYIVQQEVKKRPITMARTFRIYAPGSSGAKSAQQIISSDYQGRHRTKVQVKNLDAATVYIGMSEQMANVISGWPLAQNEVLSINAEDDVWAASSGTTDAQLAVLVEYQNEY